MNKYKACRLMTGWPDGQRCNLRDGVHQRGAG